VILADSHCHLDDPQFDADREAVIERARAAGVETMLAVGSGPPDLEAGIRLAEGHAQIVASVGVHPHEAAKATPETFERLRELLANPKVVAIGEIGLDYHYNFSPPEVQREVFARQLEMARAASRPVIIHTREAWPDTLRMLAEARLAGGFLRTDAATDGFLRARLEVKAQLLFEFAIQPIRPECVGQSR